MVCCLFFKCSVFLRNSQIAPALPSSSGGPLPSTPAATLPSSPAATGDLRRRRCRWGRGRPICPPSALFGALGGKSAFHAPRRRLSRHRRRNKQPPAAVPDQDHPDAYRAGRGRSARCPVRPGMTKRVGQDGSRSGRTEGNPLSRPSPPAAALPSSPAAALPSPPAATGGLLRHGHHHVVGPSSGDALAGKAAEGNDVGKT